MQGKVKVENLQMLVALFGKIKEYDWHEPLEISYEPFAVARQLDQNALSHVWYRQAAKQLGDREIWEVADECKLDYAVPILLANNQEFRELFKYCLAPYHREQRIEILGKGFVNCTRLLTRKEFTEYLNGIQNYYGKNGIHLVAQGEYEELMLRAYD
jgi:hypothetical protein